MGCAAKHTVTAPRPMLCKDGPATVVRAMLHALKFALGYFVMLMAMYYNGYVLLCMVIGAFLGALLFGHETRQGEVPGCCGTGFVEGSGWMTGRENRDDNAA